MSMMTIRESGQRGSRRTAYRPLSEINVTPLVDVMLVLLVVFMITAPLMTVGVPVDLPKTQSAQIVGEDEPIVVTVNASGKIYIQEAQVKMRSLAARLSALTKNRRDMRIFVRGDRRIDYGRVMEVMGRINSAGFSRVALITQLPTSKKSDRKRN